MLESSQTPQENMASPIKLSLWEKLKFFFLGNSSDGLRESLTDALETEEESANFSPQEKIMLRNVLQMRETQVADVMVPRADIIAVSLDTTLADLLQVFRTQNHSRLPVYHETLDDPRGMVHIRDFLDHLAKQFEKKTKESSKENGLFLGKLKLTDTLATADITRPVLYAPEAMPAIDLLVKMQSTRTHMALIIDEYGGTDGLVSIEDLVEMIVGDIEDEHDEDEDMPIIQTADGAYLINARASIEEVEIALGYEFPEKEYFEEIDTLAGLIVSKIGRVPVKGEILPILGMEFEIQDVDSRRIKRIRCKHQNKHSKADVQDGNTQ